MVKIQGNAGPLGITSRPDKNTDIIQDRQAYKQLVLQFNAHRVIVSQERSKQTKGLLNMPGLFCDSSLLHQVKHLGNRDYVSKIYYDLNPPPANPHYSSVAQ
jgi:hypothetical protein